MTSGLLAASLTWWVALSHGTLPVRWHMPHASVLTWQDGQTAHVDLAPDGRSRLRTTRAQVDPAYLRALIAYEDSRFYSHPGIDPLAILRAVGSNVAAGRVVSGASTLSQQVVRMLEPRPRTVRSKLVEVLRTLTLESKLSKEEVLDAYLTFAPFGGNLEGVRAASLAYFGHEPDTLTLDEIAVLLAVPQRPAARRPSPARREALTAARNAVLARLVDAGVADPVEAQHAQRMPVPDRLLPVPRELPHVAAMLRARHGHVEHWPTTLDREAQRQARRLLASHQSERAAQGIRDAAVLLSDPTTGAVRVAIGGHDFFSGTHGAQIAAYNIPRSPGSTLKPLLVAHAMDLGVALPDHLVRDVPVSWASYTPENYDRAYRGAVRLEDALVQSLNIPMVELLQDVGVERFVQLLRAGGASSLHTNPDHYGLSAIVGGIELTALELLGLYHALANHGQQRLPQFVRADTPEDPLQLLHAGSAWRVAGILRGRDRPDRATRRGWTGSDNTLAWKTGTSFGHRDAWAVGWDHQHTALVWFGNVDRSASRQLVGADASGALLFDLLESLQTSEGLDEAALARATPPDDLIQVQVCALSGHLPSDACPTKTTAWALRTAVPTAACTHHRTVWVEQATGLAVTPDCPHGPAQQEPFIVWPAAVRRWLSDPTAWGARHPAWAEGCAPATTSAQPLVWRAPQLGAALRLSRDLTPDQQQVAFEVDAPADVHDVAWFVDGVFVARHPADQPMWWTPSAGEHVVVAQTGRGDSLSRSLTVVLDR